LYPVCPEPPAHWWKLTGLASRRLPSLPRKEECVGGGDSCRLQGGLHASSGGVAADNMDSSCSCLILELILMILLSLASFLTASLAASSPDLRRFLGRYL
jgi:hypothetical protein